MSITTEALFGNRILAGNLSSGLRSHFENIFSNPLVRIEPFYSNILWGIKIQENFCRLYLRLMRGNLLKRADAIEEMIVKWNEALNDSVMQEVFFSLQGYTFEQDDYLLRQAVYDSLEKNRLNTAAAFGNMFHSPSLRGLSLMQVILMQVFRHHFEQAIQLTRLLPDFLDLDYCLDPICLALVANGYQNWAVIEEFVSRIKDVQMREEVQGVIELWMLTETPSSGIKA